MFKFIQYLRYDEYLDRYIYKLADTGFECQNIEIMVEEETETVIGMAMAKEYERRNLNAAANLALYFRYVMAARGYKFNDIKYFNDVYYPQHSKEFYSKYLNDINRYLILM